MSTHEQDAVRDVRDALLARARAEAALVAARAHTRDVVLTHAAALVEVGWRAAAREIGNDENGVQLITEAHLRGLARPALP